MTFQYMILNNPNDFSKIENPNCLILGGFNVRKPNNMVYGKLLTMDDMLNFKGLRKHTIFITEIGDFKSHILMAIGYIKGVNAENRILPDLYNHINTVIDYPESSDDDKVKAIMAIVNCKREVKKLDEKIMLIYELLTEEKMSKFSKYLIEEYY